MNKIYLAGPVTHSNDPNGWRDIATSILETWPRFEAINPLTVEARVKTDAEIVALDYRWILDSRAILAEVFEPSWGTAMEIAFAKQHGIPVFAWGKHPDKCSPWLRHHATKIDYSMSGAINTLRNWSTEHGYL